MASGREVGRAAIGRTVPLRVLDTDLDLVCTGPRAEEVFDALALRWALTRRADDAPAALRIEVALTEAGQQHRAVVRPPPQGLAAPPDLVAGGDLDRLLVDATHAVTYAAIAAESGRLLMLHASALAHPGTGAAVVAVAPGGTGKTTLCRALGPGRAYLTDETVGVRADGTVAAYPKPLSVRRPGSGEKDEVDPRSLGLTAPAVDASVHAVLLLDRDDSAGPEPVVTTLDPFLALTDLAPETSALDLLDRPLHRLHDLVAGVSLLARVRYADAVSLGPLVEDLIGPLQAGTP